MSAQLYFILGRAKLEKFQCTLALPNLKYNCVVLQLQLQLFIYLFVLEHGHEYNNCDVKPASFISIKVFFVT